MDTRTGRVLKMLHSMRKNGKIFYRGLYHSFLSESVGTDAELVIMEEVETLYECMMTKNILTKDDSYIRDFIVSGLAEPTIKLKRLIEQGKDNDGRLTAMLLFSPPSSEEEELAITIINELYEGEREG